MINHPLSELLSQTKFLENIAEQYGTPAYVYSKDRLEENINRLSNAISNSFNNYQIYYQICMFPYFRKQYLTILR